MKIYTKTGDKGTTSLYDGKRVPKDSLRVESYGTIDELNSSLGLARQFIDDDWINDIIKRLQRELFDVAGELATLDREKFPEKINDQHVEYLEHTIDLFLDKMGKDRAFQFILPGSNKGSAALHVSRTICRRAERRILTLEREGEDLVSPILIKYINRLSDVIYAMARYFESELTYIEFEK